jgi:IclR family transcriptional regulator, acetate operon repressor
VSSVAVKSAARTLDILEFIARSTEPPTFLEISRILNVPRSSLFHLLNTLGERGYIVQVGRRGGYGLGQALHALVSEQAALPQAVTLVAPLLKEISGPLNETAAYYELRDFSAEVLATEAGRQALLYSLSVGQRAPLHAVSAGKVLLASSSEALVNEYFETVERAAYNANTITDEPTLRAQLDQARETGFAYSFEEHTLGIVGVSRGVVDAQGKPGAVNVAVPAVRFTAEARKLIERQLTDVCARIQKVLTQLSTADRKEKHGR